MRVYIIAFALCVVTFIAIVQPKDGVMNALRGGSKEGKNAARNKKVHFVYRIDDMILQFIAGR